MILSISITSSCSRNIISVVFILHLVLLLASSKFCFCWSAPHPGEQGGAAASSPLFIFGDSFLDAGNNNYINTTTLDKADFWPYGMTYFNRPTGRFSDGRLISDFIAEYANLSLIPPLLQPRTNHLFYHGANFASAGAGALAGTFHGMVIDLHTQLRLYKRLEARLVHTLGDAGATKRLNKAVYLFSIGINDYMSLFLTNSTLKTSYSKFDYVQLVLGSITSVIKDIYESGGRKFGFINVPPLGCIPALRLQNLNENGDGSCLTEASRYANIHNKAFYKHLKKLRRELPGFRYSYFNFYSCLNQMINQPFKHGYMDGKTACCGTGKYRGIFSCGGQRVVKEFELCRDVGKHVFWDSIHLTEKAYRQLADQMWNKRSERYLTRRLYDIQDLFQLG